MLFTSFAVHIPDSIIFISFNVLTEQQLGNGVTVSQCEAHSRARRAYRTKIYLFFIK